MPVGLAIVHCARRGNGLGSRKRAASPSRAACTCPVEPHGARPGGCRRGITTAARRGRIGQPVGSCCVGKLGEIGDHWQCWQCGSYGKPLVLEPAGLPTPPLSEGTGRTPARNAPRRTAPVARSATAASSLRRPIPEIWPVQKKTYGFVVRKKHVPVHILSVPVQKFRRLLPTGRDRF